MTDIVFQHPTDNRFNSYSYDDIYLGVGTKTASGENFIVPRVGDMIVQRGVGIHFVSAVTSDNIAILEFNGRLAADTSINPNSDSLITATTKYQPSIVQNAFHDTSVVPATLAIDRQFQVLGSEVKHAIIFRGYDVSEASNIISEEYDSAGNLVGNLVGLEPVETGLDTIKVALTTKTTALLNNGEVITAVFYGASGNQLSEQTFSVRSTSFVHSSARSNITITDVVLESTLIDPVKPTEVRNRQNIPITTALFSAKLLYSNGSVKDNIAIDGSKCRLFGMEHHDTSAIGTPTVLTLSYYPDPDEPFVSGQSGKKPHITRQYSLLNIAYDTAYALKVFPIFTYLGALEGYSVRWWLHNLEGDINMDVTDHTQALLPDGRSMSLVDFETLQEITVKVDMATIAPTTYPDHIHTQILDVTLARPGAVGYVPWLLDFAKDKVLQYNDVSASASAINGGLISISQRVSTINDWLERIYYPIYPLYNNDVMEIPITPTHFILKYGGIEQRYEITEWNDEFVKHPDAPNFEENDTVEIVWILEKAGADFFLGHSGLLLKMDL